MCFNNQIVVYVICPHWHWYWSDTENMTSFHFSIHQWVFTHWCLLQDCIGMISFSIWLKFYLVRMMDECDGCESSILRAVCLNGSLWVGRTQSLSYIDWTHCPSISIPWRILTDSLQATCLLHFILSCGAPQSNADSPYYLNFTRHFKWSENWDTRLLN